MATQAQLALQMIAQLRVLDPAISAEIGTPERKIIDTVAQALAETQIDLDLLSGGLDIDSKFGADLDTFLGIFGFGRQKATKSTGFVSFSRTDASLYDIPIPAGSQVVAPSVTALGDSVTDIFFQTNQGVTLPAGSTSVVAPIEALVAGSLGNLAADTITELRSSVLGITAVTNDAATQNGVDQESDDEFKLRFKNTVFRNLSGTTDQFLALAVSTAFTTKANVVGPISRYLEYIQVPDVDDTAADPDSGIGGNSATVGEYTSALSTIPYSKHVYDTIPYFISNNKSGADSIFYRQDTDFYLNTTPGAKNRGDAYRGAIAGVSTSPLDTSTLYQPSITFKNIVPATSPDVIQGVRAKDVVLFEHSYLSTASRNDYTRNVTNCVDVFINGQNPTLATSVIARPSSANIFTASATSPYYFNNFRRIGEPNHRPILGNIYTPLFFTPLTELPNTIIANNVTYLNGVHYWLIKDISAIGSSVRARDGIEWATVTNGLAAGDNVAGPYTGARITANAATSVEIDNYSYDRNLNDLQVIVEANKQTTTDALAHTANTRYFKLDLTVMYTAGASVSDTNTTIAAALTAFFDGQYFGTTIQTSDLLQAVHNVSGVDNVRWSKEILTAQGLTVDTSGNARDRVVECDANGNPLVNLILDRKVTGDGGTVEVWQMYLTGSPTGGSFTISYANFTTAAIAYNAASGTITTALAAATIPATVTGGTGTALDPWIVTFSAPGTRLPNMLSANTTKLTGGTTVFNSDFYLTDDQLPALPSGAVTTDTVAGLIVRPRAQNTWNQL